MMPMIWEAQTCREEVSKWSRAHVFLQRHNWGSATKFSMRPPGSQETFEAKKFFRFHPDFRRLFCNFWTSVLSFRNNMDSNWFKRVPNWMENVYFRTNNVLDELLFIVIVRTEYSLIFFKKTPRYKFLSAGHQLLMRFYANINDISSPKLFSCTVWISVLF